MIVASATHWKGSALVDNWSVIWRLTLDHLVLVVPATAAGVMASSALLRIPRRRTDVPLSPVDRSEGVALVPFLGLVVLLPVIPFLRPVGSRAVAAAIAVTVFAMVTWRGRRAFAALPHDAVEAAVAIGHSPRQRMAMVESPLASPILRRNVRMALAVATSMATAGALVGGGGLGRLFTDVGRRDVLRKEAFVGLFMLAIVNVVLDAAVRVAAHGVDASVARRRDPR